MGHPTHTNLSRLPHLHGPGHPPDSCGPQWEVSMLIADREATELPATTEQRAAAGIASEIADLEVPRKAWLKVTSVLDRFGEESLNHEVGRRIDAALSEAGLRVEPSL